MKLAGGYNFRDLGGLAAGGGRIAKGRFMRGDEMGGLTNADLDNLARIPLATVVDFRAPAETRANPDRLPASVTRAIHIPIIPGNLGPEFFEGIKSPGDMERLMDSIYAHMVTDAATVAKFREFFALVQDRTKLPLLYHCTAGKDRTGIATALLLTALGSDRQTILDDYLASNHYLLPKYERMATARPELAPGFFVKAEYLETAFAAIEREHGTAEDFLEKTLCVDMAALRAGHVEML